MLVKRLTDEEISLLEILQDPVWLGEFLRSTADFSANEEEREHKAKKPFRYRWYQIDLLTDKSPAILLRGGRAIGKCHPATTWVYTPEGYVMIRDILQRKDPAFVLVTLDKNGRFTQRRAYLASDGVKPVYRVTTASGNKVDVTDNHPMLTPEGWVPLKELSVGSVVASVNSLPSYQTEEMYVWEELRYIGYLAANSQYMRVSAPIYCKYTAQVEELRRIAKFFNTHVKEHPGNGHAIVHSRHQKSRGQQHYGTVLSHSFKYHGSWSSDGIRILPVELKRQAKHLIKVFLESFLSLRAEFTAESMSFTYPFIRLTRDVQELLLRFGIRTTIEPFDERGGKLTIASYEDFYTLMRTFNFPGIHVKSLEVPTQMRDETAAFFFEEIVSIVEGSRQPTYVIQVMETENYIAEGLVVHNSVVLEDKLVYNGVNANILFPETKQSVLVTANNNQMTPLIDGVTSRFMTSPLLRGFLNGNVNRSKGTLDFSLAGSSPYRMYARIAGSKGENNMIGLHVPKIYGDEIQVFPYNSWVQLQPVLNHWEEETQIFVCGVPNGIREGSVMYMLDERTAMFKKYRIPATENPVWTLELHIEAIRKNGEDSDEFNQLVLGRHGDIAFSIIPRDKIKTEPYEFYSYRYTQTDKVKGKDYKEMIGLPQLGMKQYRRTVFAIDTGYADPTIIQLLGQKDNVWYVLARWRLTRIAFPEQAEIIDYLDTKYNPETIGIDTGAGGGGIGIIQDLQSARFGVHKQYNKRIQGINFSMMSTTAGANDVRVSISAKSAAGEELARMIADQELVFSEIDGEGLSQLERVAYQRKADGANTYYVLSEKGKGRSDDDHIFASYIVFILVLMNSRHVGHVSTKLAKARWL